MTNEALLGQKAGTPGHVVYRPFVKETVILNLQTGKYHGLNPTGGRMLELLEGSGTMGEAARKLAEEYGGSLETLQADLCDFCRDLLERGLIELRAPDGVERPAEAAE
jgi:coenzyme PQQ synthesis protein D (PqqD)